MLRDSCGGLQLASGSSAVRFRRSRFTANGSGCPCERTGPMELMGLMWESRSCSPRIFGGRLQNVIRPPGYFLPAVLSFLREAAWSSQGVGHRNQSELFYYSKAGSVSSAEH